MTVKQVFWLHFGILGAAVIFLLVVAWYRGELTVDGWSDHPTTIDQLK